MSIRAEDVPGLDLSDVAGAERIGPVVPGEVLREEFMAPLGLSGRALARELIRRRRQCLLRSRQIAHRIETGVRNPGRRFSFQ